MKNAILLLLCIFGAGAVSGCSTFALGELDAAGAQSSAICITGSGPPMTGGGNVAGAKTNEGFKGSVTVTPDCGVQIIQQ